MQDAHFACELNSAVGSVYVFAVFDGHGLAGEYASQKAKETVQAYLTGELPKLHNETADWAKFAGMYSYATFS